MKRIELTKKFMEEHAKVKKGMKVSWNEYIKRYEKEQKEMEQKKKQQERLKEQKERSGK